MKFLPLKHTLICTFFFACVSHNVSVSASALEIDGNGDVGIGTASPNAPLHVYRNNGSARITVEENNGTVGPRTLFELKNNGNTKFNITETNTGTSWAFANSGFQFRVSRQGSGVVEFQVDNNGNAQLAGVLTQNSSRDSKQAIEQIDQTSVLNSLLALPIFEWEYKDAPGIRHIGPMAQDFYTTFGLGDNAEQIATIDTSGVALLSIQALATQNNQLRNQNQDLSERVQALENKIVLLQQQQAKIGALEAMLYTQLNNSGMANPIQKTKVATQPSVIKADRLP